MSGGYRLQISVWISQIGTDAVQLSNISSLIGSLRTPSGKLFSSNVFLPSFVRLTPY